jgi:UDP-GlcNAc3NAcA epimerase
MGQLREERVKIVSVIGARPQFVKAAMLSRELRATPGVHEIVVHTGQHYDDRLSSVFFEELEMRPPDHFLGAGSGPHGAQTARMLAALEPLLVEHAPRWVVLYGDTNSTIAGALAAAKLCLPIAHVEAGLRSFNRSMPEEINRVLTDHVSDLLFAPTELAVANLRREGIAGAKVLLTGDVMYDAALHYASVAQKGSRVLTDLNLTPHDYIVATIHRAENTAEAATLGRLCAALSAVAQSLPVIWPVHPRTRAALDHWQIQLHPAVRLLEPLGYLDMTQLLKHAALVATDSGGVQKEAFFHRVPCVTLRSETEWPELVELGWNRLAPPDDASAVTAVLEAALAASPGYEAEPYGAGDAARKMCAALVQ